ncbi:hypothetical protein HK100_003933, partial [Physocladia obscura]
MLGAPTAAMLLCSAAGKQTRRVILNAAKHKRIGSQHNIFKSTAFGYFNAGFKTGSIISNGLNTFAVRGFATKPGSRAQHGFSSFAEKSGQMARVSEILREKGFIPTDLIAKEIEFFYG